ncbi:unnamed protein product [Meganyctiphanes norvegica]|uniref:Uncharacterized protein n=1 Tax=Meganyctiphanes norvegica TaxID=48144 RepID=A0AAV2S9U8_MEGNR
MLITIFSPAKVLSICNPKYLTLFTLFITTSPLFTSKDLILLNFLFDPKIIASVFPRCKDSLLSISHCLHDSSSFERFSAITFGSDPEIINALSSAYKSNLHLTLIGMSFT